jgi:hypothetical protein
VLSLAKSAWRADAHLEVSALLQLSRRLLRVLEAEAQPFTAEEHATLNAQTRFLEANMKK